MNKKTTYTKEELSEFIKSYVVPEIFIAVILFAMFAIGVFGS